MPLVAIKVKDLNTKRSEIHVTELVNGVDYFKISQFLNATASSSRETPKPSFSKAELNRLLVLAQSDRERELIKYATFKASGLSKSSSSRKHYGFQNLTERSTTVEEAIQEAECIRNCIEDLSTIQEKSFLQSLGLNSSDTSESESDDETDRSSDESIEDTLEDNAFSISEEEFFSMIQRSHFNWFQVVSSAMEMSDRVREK